MLEHSKRALIQGYGLLERSLVKTNGREIRQRTRDVQMVLVQAAQKDHERGPQEFARFRIAPQRLEQNCRVADAQRREGMLFSVRHPHNAVGSLRNLERARGTVLPEVERR